MLLMILLALPSRWEPCDALLVLGGSNNPPTQLDKASRELWIT